jgi:hypothetical protein
LAPEDERPPKALEAELERLESKYEIFKIRLFQEYRKYVLINSSIAAVLAVILCVIAYKSQAEVAGGYIWITVVISALSLLPAPFTLALLWRDAGRQVKPIKDEADNLEQRALKSYTAEEGERLGPSSHS